MGRPPRELDLEALVVQTQEHGPRILKEQGIRLGIVEAQTLCKMLASRQFPIEPFSFPATKGVWNATNEEGVQYSHIALKYALEHIAEKQRVADFTTFEGFKQLLPFLTEKTLTQTPIDRWGMTANSLLTGTYNGSVANAVLDLIAHDSSFTHIRDLQRQDFPNSSGYWGTPENPSAEARAATRQLIESLAAGKPLTFKNIKNIIPNITQDSFTKHPINRWGTTLGGVINCAYRNSPSAAIFDLIAHDAALTRFADLRPYDFAFAPRGLWVDQSQPTSIAREATKRLIATLADEHAVDYRTFEGFRTILPHLTQDALKFKPINRWGTTLQGMLGTAYHGSPSAAVLDLIANDAEFTPVADLKPFDFLQAPFRYWSQNGKPTEAARTMTKQLVTLLAAKEKIDYRTFEGFKQLVPQFTMHNFSTFPVTRWGTTLNGMITNAYSSSPSAAIIDLIKSDDAFAHVRDLKAYDFSQAPNNTWFADGPTQTARDATQQLLITLARQGNLDHTRTKDFKALLPALTFDAFQNTPINRWGTTLCGMLSNAYDGSTISAIKDLIKHDASLRHLRGISNDLLSGPPETRIARADGTYRYHQIRKCLSESGLDLGRFGFFTFKDGEKKEIRELLAETVQARFGAKPIAYFGLEGPTFGSYFTFAKHLHIDASRSLVAERNPRAYAVMSRIKRMKSVNDLLNGNKLSSLELQLATAEKALGATDKRFDLIFLDWLGHIAPSNKRELDLADRTLNANGVLALTVNNAPLSEKRYRMQGGCESQETFLHTWAAEKGYNITATEYDGGNTRKIPMALYVLERKL